MFVFVLNAVLSLIWLDHSVCQNTVVLRNCVDGSLSPHAVCGSHVLVYHSCGMLIHTATTFNA